MTLNYIWWWGPSPQNQASIEYTIITITPRYTLIPSVPSISLIDMFKKLFVFDRTMWKKTLKKQLHKKYKYEHINAIPWPLGTK